MNCQSKHVVYLITCTKCNLQYIGETGQQLKDRLIHHLSDIKTKKASTISIHFNSPSHSKLDLNVVGIEQIQSDSIQVRRQREKQWMDKMQTKYPRGLNNFPT